MNAHEEELQKKIENGQRPDGDDVNAKAYQEVFKALGKDPGYELPPQFASKVVERLAARKERDQSRDYFWFFAGVVFLLVVAAGTIMYVGYQLDLGFLKGMAQYKGLAGFGIALIIFLNWLDKRLVREKLFQH